MDRKQITWYVGFILGAASAGLTLTAMGQVDWVRSVVAVVAGIGGGFLAEFWAASAEQREQDADPSDRHDDRP